MKKTMKKIWIAALCVFSLSSSAYALIDLDLVANGSLKNLNTLSDPKLGFGGGALLGLELIPDGALETGLIWDTRKAAVDFGPFSTEATFKYLQVPVMFRYNIIPLLNLHGGVYYAQGMGNIGVETTGPGFTFKSTSSYGAAASRSDYGFKFGAGVKIPMVMYHIVANANYMLGMKDTDSGTASEKWKGLEFQAGIGFGI